MIKKISCVLFLFAILHSVIAGEEFPRVNAVVRAVMKSGKAVVNISTEWEERYVDLFSPFRRDFFGDPFEDFFNRFRPRRYTRKIQSAGSGVIIDRDGYIITNEHVIHGVSEIMVTFLGDEKKYKGTVISSIPEKDLALIKVDVSALDLHPIEMGSSKDLMIGETAIALGNPFGLENTVTTGVISAKDRSIYSEGNVVFSGLIQTDAAINPGNSGGALLDINGRLIGINTAIKKGAEGIGFAIPVDDVINVLKDLLSLKKINRLWLGVKVEDTEKGKIRVIGVEKNSPAEKAGIKVGDNISQVNRKKIKNCFEFSKRIISESKEKKTIRLKVNGRVKKITLVKYGENMIAGRCGFKGVVLTAWMARRLQMSMVENGVLVTEIRTHSPADEIGLEVGDVVVQLGNTRILKVDDIVDVLENFASGSSIEIFVVRGDKLLKSEIEVE